MAIARTATELRRFNDLAAVRRAIVAAMPDMADRPIGLKEVARLCRRRQASRPARDLHEVRDLLLTIGCEWDLANDRLDDQSSTCLRYLARLLL